MYNNNLPNLQPGQRIIVRHHNNGDTEYICRRDSSLDFATGGGFFEGLFKWFVFAVLAFFLWNMLTGSPAERTGKKAGARQEQAVVSREY